MSAPASVFLALTLAAAPVNEPAEAAASQEQLDEAKRHFTQGATLYEEGDFEGARIEFERAHELSGNHRILYNIAVVRLDLHDYVGAKRAYEDYLSAGGDKLTATRRAEVEQEIEELAKRVGTLSISSSVSGAVVRVDGQVVGQTPLVEDASVSLGSHEIAVEADGHERYVTTVDVGGGERVEISAELEPVAVAPVPRPQPAPTTSPASSTTPADHAPVRQARVLRTLTWSFLGATAAVGIGATVTGVLASQANDDLEGERNAIPGDEDRLDTLSNRTRGLALSTDILLGVTGALALTTIGLAIAAARATKRTRRVAVAHDGLRIHF